MLEVYADESHDEKQESVFAVSGLLGTEREWDDVEGRWKAVFGDLTFHAADIESDPPRGDFEGKSRQECIELMHQAVDILVDSRILGFGCCLDIRDFREIYPGDRMDAPYYFCFQNALLELAEVSTQIIPPEIVNFTFDRNRDYCHNATILFDKFTKVGEWPSSLTLGKISFADKQLEKGLQPADLFAREVFKHRYNQLTSNRPLRIPLRRLADTKRFRLQFWSKGDLLELKDVILEHLRKTDKQ